MVTCAESTGQEGTPPLENHSLPPEGFPVTAASREAQFRIWWRFTILAETQSYSKDEGFELILMLNCGKF